MASKMTLVFLISVTLTLLGICYFLVRQETSEGFQTQGYSVNNLNINTCPTYTSEIQTSKGSTDCCQGDMVDGKCNGTTFCTKSPAYEDVPACIDRWRQYFREKGTSICPPSMPNYYEDVTNPSAAKGCSASAILEDGKAPTDGTRAQCRIYTTEDENKRNLNSCYLEKERLKIQCPVVNGRSPQASMISDQVTKQFQMFSCQYPFELGMPDRCYDKKTFEVFMDSKNRNWRTNSIMVADVNNQSCSNYINRRNQARDEMNRAEAERRRREAAEARARQAQASLARFRSLFQRQQQTTSRLQQQLDIANRRVQNRRRR